MTMTKQASGRIVVDTLDTRTGRNNHRTPGILRSMERCSLTGRVIGCAIVLGLFLVLGPGALSCSIQDDVLPSTGAKGPAHQTPAKRPRVAALITEFTYRSHAHVILENFLEKYYFNGELTDPGVDIVCF